MAYLIYWYYIPFIFHSDIFYYIRGESWTNACMFWLCIDCYEVAHFTFYCFVACFHHKHFNDCCPHSSSHSSPCQVRCCWTLHRNQLAQLLRTADLIDRLITAKRYYCVFSKWVWTNKKMYFHCELESGRWATWHPVMSQT